MDLKQEEYVPMKKKRNGKKAVIITALVSGLAGAMIALLTVPYLIRTGYFPGWATTTMPDTIPIGNNSNLPVANYNVNVETAVTKAVAKVENAVVGVVNMQRGGSFLDARESVDRGTGSGIIFKKSGDKGYIVTNNHVISGANEIEVSLHTGDRIKAKVVGADALSDLAVLEVDGSKIDSVAEFGTSSSLKVGEPAIAIGNPLGLEFSRTVTQGIISSIDRSIPIDVNNDGRDDYELNVLQTDAAINPGNSGGALVNISGQVIGINSLKISQTGVEGLGFAIPIDDAVKVINDLITYKQVQRPYMGVESVDLQSIPKAYWSETLNLPGSVKSGVVIKDVATGSPADKVGLKRYDVIVKLDGQNIENSLELRKFLYKKKIGDTIQVSYYRDGKLKTEKMTLQKREE